MMGKQDIFSILREQNYWFREPPVKHLVPRPDYLTRMDSFMESKAILTIKGPRRAGKTVLMDLVIRKMISEGMCSRMGILYVNLEDYRFYDQYSLELLERILESYLENIPASEHDDGMDDGNADDKENSDGYRDGVGNRDSRDPIYFFIDEIQHIPGFEHFLRTKYDDENPRIKFIVTGSNARLLSRELGTLLTGRMVSMEVFPFSFEEYLSYHQLDFGDRSYYALESHRMKIVQRFNTYLRNGGIPEFLDEPDPMERLREYFDNVLFRDIVDRQNIRNVRQLKELALFLITNSASQYSVNRISRMLGASVNTITAYLSDLESSYLLIYLKQYSASFRTQITTKSKAYCLDTGLMNAVGFRFSEGRGHLLEDLVFIHLVRQGNDLYYHRNPVRKRECDFLVKAGLKITQAIQVAQTLGTESTRTREIEGLIDAGNQFHLEEGLILTEDEFETFDQDGMRIKVRPIWFWLLNPDE